MHLLSPTEGVDPAVLRDQPTFLRLSVHHSQNPRGFAERVPPVMNRGYRYRLLISLDIIKPNRLISLYNSLCQKKKMFEFCFVRFVALGGWYGEPKKRFSNLKTHKRSTTSRF